MTGTTAAPNNKAIAFGNRPARELAGAAKKATVRKKAKKAISRGMISERAAAKHLAGL